MGEEAGLLQRGTCSSSSRSRAWSWALAKVTQLNSSILLLPTSCLCP